MTELLVRLAYKIVMWGGEHHYLSTGCLHGGQGHTHCAAMVGVNGAKRPATCKWCLAPCRCRCHGGSTA